MDNKSKISVCVISFNEERNIEECLKSVAWADEIIMVDSFSTDRTIEIAKQYTSKIFLQEWKGYSEAKIYAVQNTSYDWILSIDADERVTPELKNEIIAVINDRSKRYTGYKVARRAYFLGKWIKHCGWYPGYVVRLFRKDSGTFSKSRVHERFELVGETGTLKHDLLHFTDDNLLHYFNKFNKYTSLAADDLEEKGTDFRVWHLFIKPIYTFFKMFILKRGFLDGLHGFILSVLSSAYVFTKYAKLWEIKLSKTNKKELL
ncbi:MAG: glycosyltransferase family 2 protein [Bacteroidota bacterium]|nr:glycosyltransferase family 2 protein [Bacteroidota bacterium]